MSKIELNSVQGGYNLSTINSNFEEIEEQLNTKVLYRASPEGEPNSMEQDFDMNGFDVINADNVRATDVFIQGVSILDYIRSIETPTVDPIEVAMRRRTFVSPLGGETIISLTFPYTGTKDGILVMRNGVVQDPSSFELPSAFSLEVVVPLSQGEVLEAIYFNVDVGLQGPAGENGDSAYEIAVANGYADTEAEWLLSLEGTDGIGITNVLRTAGDGSPGSTDTYTITFSDDTTTTFDVYNGTNGTGIPNGGVAGQLLMKSSAVDGEVEWLGDPPTFDATSSLNNIDHTGWYRVINPIVVDGPTAASGICHTSIYRENAEELGAVQFFNETSEDAWFWYRIKSGTGEEGWGPWYRVYTGKELDPYLDVLFDFPLNTLATTSADAKAILVAANYAAMRALLDLEVGVDVQAYDADTAKLDVAQSWTGDQTFRGLYETVFVVTGTTPALDATNGTIQSWVLTGNSTPTSNLGSGESIYLRIADGTAFTITWPSVVWVGGSAPTLATTGWTHVELWNIGGVLYGAHIGDTA